MIGSLVFWIVIGLGAAWTAWAPLRWREPGLAVLAAALIAWADLATLVVYVGLVAAVWRLVSVGRPSRACTMAVLALVLGLVACKWAQAMENGVAGPLGLSYLVFRLIHVLIEARRGLLPPVREWSEFMHYFLSPALFAAGPLERWDHFTAERLEKLDGVRAAEAVQRITIGIAKKVLIADGLLVRVAQQVGVADMDALTPAASPGSLWLGTLLSYARVYTEFSGYSDIAVGAGLLWGRRIMENFNWPILATTPSDFWRRWHISLSQWCARYVYMRAIGYFRNPFVPLFASFLVMALWHYIGWNRVGWALYQTAGVLVHLGWCRLLGRAQPGTWRAGWTWRITSCLITQTFVVGSYVFLSRKEEVSLDSSLALLMRMFGVS